jgi:hypothetical protein
VCLSTDEAVLLAEALNLNILVRGIARVVQLV